MNSLAELKIWELPSLKPDLSDIKLLRDGQEVEVLSHYDFLRGSTIAVSSNVAPLSGIMVQIIEKGPQKDSEGAVMGFYYRLIKVHANRLQKVS